MFGLTSPPPGDPAGSSHTASRLRPCPRLCVAWDDAQSTPPPDLPVPEGPSPVPPELPEPPKPAGEPPPMENPVPVREPPTTLPPQSRQADTV